MLAWAFTEPLKKSFQLLRTYNEHVMKTPACQEAGIFTMMTILLWGNAQTEQLCKTEDPSTMDSHLATEQTPLSLLP